MKYIFTVRKRVMKNKIMYFYANDTVHADLNVFTTIYNNNNNQSSRRKILSFYRLHAYGVLSSLYIAISNIFFIAAVDFFFFF